MNAFAPGFTVSDAVLVQRENMRAVLALTVAGLLAVYSLLLIVFVWTGHGGASLDKLITGIFTPIVGIVGTVIGFYFGSKDSAG